MNIIYLQSLSLLIVSWLIIICVFIGYGIAIQHLICSENNNPERIFLSFWIGGAVIIVLLQIVHFFFPISLVVSLVLGIVGLILFFINRNRILKSLNFIYVKNPVFTIWIILSFLFVGNQAMDPIGPFDAGLYQLQTIKWFSSFPIVPGLGNLHGRFAFNSSIYLFQSMLNVSLWSSKTHHLAHGILLIIFLARIGLSLSKILLNKLKFHVSDLFLLLLIPGMIKLTFREASSTSTGLALWLIGLIVGIELCEILYNNLKSSDKVFDGAFAIVILSCLGVTIKLSFIGFALISSCVAVFIWFRASLNTSRNGWIKMRLVYFSFPPILIFLPWFLRSIILSGYLAYPNTTIAFDKEWRIPIETARGELMWTKSWSRQPNVSPEIVLADKSWFKPWIKEKMRRRFDIVLPLLMFFSGSFVSLLPIRGRPPPAVKRFCLFLMPPFGLITFVFILAPDPRYVNSAFWYLACGSLSIALFRLFNNKLRNAVFISIMFSISFSLYVIYREINLDELYFRDVRKKEILSLCQVPIIYQSIPQSNELPYDKIPYDKFLTDSGLILNVPNRNSLCWDADLPCTPFADSRLKLREPGSLGNGFMIVSDKD
tara:strand:- start:1522 stop:3321 length:1800 start_codon:yes stop_codon:yes gene_type:complete